MDMVFESSKKDKSNGVGVAGLASDVSRLKAEKPGSQGI
jgi:hypothetical protein